MKKLINFFKTILLLEVISLVETLVLLFFMFPQGTEVWVFRGPSGFTIAEAMVIAMSILALVFSPLMYYSFYYRRR
jgi:hypothetical protein